jgi:serine/threonine protein kinase
MVRRLSAPRPLRSSAPPRGRAAGSGNASQPHARRFATPFGPGDPRDKAGAAPSRLGRYELQRKIADGGMATVFVARVAEDARALGPAGGAGDVRPRPGEVVAIKMIREEFARSPEFLTMFMDEAKIVSRLRHPNIVRYHDFGNEGGHTFIAMELLIGQSLWSVWDACRVRGMRLRHDLIAWIGARAAEGLHHAHDMVDDQGRGLEIVHRDVNATNIFVTYGGEIKIIDFGLAKAANRASKTAAGIIKGKVAYMSPEQAVGAPIDRRTDVFALGTTLWELCCDRRLFKHADEVETLRRVHAAEVPDPTRLVEGFPPGLWRVLERALARDRDRRHATAGELTGGLDAFARAVGGRVDACAVAALMSELFAFDRARQRDWLASPVLSGKGEPSPPATCETCKVSSRTGDADVEQPLSLASLSARPARGRPWLQAHAAEIAIAVGVVIAVGVAMALVIR